jgi:hypothetical protein
MKLTEHQYTCVEKAKRYRKRNMNTDPFRALYLDACIDSYMTALEFKAMVNETNVITMKPKTDDKPIRDYISSFERDVLGKGAEDRANRR